MPDDTPTPTPTPEGRVRRPYQGATQPAPDPDEPDPVIPDDGIREE